MSRPRVRFAPSPTGSLHIGGARTALFNYLFSLKEGGDFILRFEDTDTKRNIPSAEEEIMRDLKWLGIRWSEGPDIGGKFGPYRQSERLAIYNEMANKLLKEGKAYRCYCTPRELEEMRSSLLAWGKPPSYTGKCRNLSESEKRALESEGRSPAIRFVLTEKLIKFKDLIKGDSIFDLKDEGDFVIIKSDGYPTYNFAAAIDDALMGITHVLRGDDSYANTPKQILLLKHLGLREPFYGHFPMVLGTDKMLLSKRHGAISLAEFREKGYLVEAIVNTIVRIGWSPPTDNFASLEQLASQFKIEKVSKAPGIFDINALNSINSTLLRKKRPEEMRESIRPYLLKAGLSPDSLTDEWIDSFYDLVRGNIKNLSEIEKYATIFTKDRFDIPLKIERVLKNDNIRRCIMEIESEIKGIERLTVENVRDILNRVKAKTDSQGIIKPVYLTLRLCLTGLESGPEITKIIANLGKKEVLSRLSNLKRYFPGYRME